MSLSTICRLVLATPFVASLLELTATLLPLVARLGQRIVSFQQGPITPVRAHAFETELQEILCEIGRVIVHWVYKGAIAPHRENARKIRPQSLIRPLSPAC